MDTLTATVEGLTTAQVRDNDAVRLAFDRETKAVMQSATALVQESGRRIVVEE